MYKVLNGTLPAPEHVTPQWILDALAAQGLDPSKPGYARQRIVMMDVSRGCLGCGGTGVGGCDRPL